MSELRLEASDPVARGALVTDFEYLHAGRLAKRGFLDPGRGFTKRFSKADVPYADLEGRCRGNDLEIKYHFRADTDVWETVECVVVIDTTNCPVRTVRHWFLCPICGRRVERVYLAGTIPGCRQCHQLVFPSQRLNVRRDRAIRRALAIRIRLGGALHLLSEHPPRPPGMTRKIYEKLCSQLEELEMQV